jgi:transcriptional/translational regulatory protein YebC/TACO1
MEEFELEVIDAGAEDIDVDEENGIITINTAMEDFGPMIKKLEALHIEPENAQLQRIPVSTIEVDVETAKKILRVIDLFEEDDDVQNIYHNMSLTDEIMASLES